MSIATGASPIQPEPQLAGQTVVVIGGSAGIGLETVNAEARRNASVKAGDLVTITLEPDTERREIEIPLLFTEGTGHEAHSKAQRLIVHA
jgi:NAD(P)-dependent dehydrogenase (short-subunit alcohol dehydrogenase family)